jgi:hypothetical protein
MSSIQGGMWRGPTNTKIPAITHILSYRVTGVVPTSGGAQQTFALPPTASNAAQYTPAQNSVNYAPQASPVLPNNEPQKGLRMFVTSIVVRDYGTGVLFGAGTNGTIISLADQNYNASSVYTPTVSNNAISAGNTIISVTTAAAIAASAATNSPYVQQQIGSAGLIVVNPYDQLAVGFLAPGGTVTTAATATAFTLDVFGYWAQTI